MLEDTQTNDPLEWTAADEAALQSQKDSGPPVEEVADEPLLEAAAEPAQADEEDDEDEAPVAGQRPGFVPHRKLHKAIERAKKVEDELKTEREERIRLEERTRQLFDRIQQPTQAPEKTAEPAPVPSPDEDIFGAVTHTGQRVQSIEEKIAAFEKRQEAETQTQRVIQAAAAHEKSFVAETPDYFDALQHLRQSRISELQLFGYTAEQAQAKVGQEEIHFAAQALQRKQNPAEVVYKWATQRGYTKKSPEPAPEEQTEDVATRISRAADAQARSQTLGGSGGSSAPTGITLQTVAKMSENDFAKLMETNPKALAKLMGG